MGTMTTLLNVAIAGFVFYILWTVVSPRWQFKIVVKGDVVECGKGIAESKRREVERFFLNDLKLSANLRVYGRRERTGTLTTLIQGTDDIGVKQRVRNFLLTIL